VDLGGAHINSEQILFRFCAVDKKIGVFMSNAHQKTSTHKKAQCAKKIIAHRGMPFLAHENTIESFKRAVELGADMIEFDIRRTADGNLVAFHDPSITHNHTEFLLRDLSFTKLQSIASLQKFQIPKVSEIFETFAGETCFDIEFKEENCEEETMSIVSDNQCIEDCCCTSFNEAVVRKVQSLWPDTLSGLLIEDSSMLYKYDISSLNMLCPSTKVFLANRALFTDWKMAGKYIAVWTVDDSTLLKQMFSDDLIDCIITNRSDRALKLRNQLFH
jgi:glycerophosphoryl diester phosphodiesterase